MTNPSRTILTAVILAGLCSVSLAAGPPQTNSPASLKTAVEHLISTFGDRYPQGRKFLGEIDRLRPGDNKALIELQRRSLLVNPLLGGRKVLFVTRKQYSNNHGTEATMCQTGEVNTSHFRGGVLSRPSNCPRGGSRRSSKCPKA